MAQKKNYSRYFIILQEEKKGYALASDKLPTGYVKLELKNDKCKVSYYVQNLKKEETPYCMLLILGKKNTNKTIKIGELNIDNYGRADISYEYSPNDLAGTGMKMENVSGAAIVKFSNKSFESVLSGFLTTDVPKWREYDMVDTNKEKDRCDSKKDDKKKCDKKKDKNVFDKYEDNIEKCKCRKDSLKESEEKVDKDDKENDSKEVNNVDDKENDSKEVNNVDVKENDGKLEDDKEQKLENKKVRSKKDSSSEDEKDNKKDRSEEDINDDEEMENVEDSNENNYMSSSGVDDQEFYDNSDSSQDDEYMNEENENYRKNKSKKNKKCPNGTVGEFFKNIAEGFEEVECIKEIKKCKWYKVNIQDVNNMYCITNYNKYTVVYYPMINYYPYIRNYGHYLIGYKCDKKNNMKYLVYAIPGKKNKCSQPYGGKTGFVTWVPNEKSNSDDGYWLMFYDFRTSTIVIPIK